mmetsp:Transcript_63341/g.142861  ORF Transcript_63341/g.142861 Transcript_63341/m.142861 type:complete len:208 (-) Transcript_63341:219-842(-)
MSLIPALLVLASSASRRSFSRSAHPRDPLCRRAAPIALLVTIQTWSAGSPAAATQASQKSPSPSRPESSQRRHSSFATTNESCAPRQHHTSIKLPVTPAMRAAALAASASLICDLASPSLPPPIGSSPTKGLRVCSSKCSECGDPPVFIADREGCVTSFSFLCSPRRAIESKKEGPAHAYKASPSPPSRRRAQEASARSSNESPKPR